MAENQQVVDGTEAHFPIHLENTTKSNDVHAYVTGSSIARNGALFLLRADGKTSYFPENPPSTSPLAHDCAIPLGQPGNTKEITIPHLTSARVWFVIGKLDFKLVPSANGPTLQQPSETEKGTHNASVHWGFTEFTYDQTQLFANISQVDLVGLPFALTLHTNSGHTQNVPGLPSNAVAKVCKTLEKLAERDRDWGQLVVKQGNDDYLRAISPSQGVEVFGLFKGYYDEYVDKVWTKYKSEPLLINTADAGVLHGHVDDQGVLKVGQETFTKPTTKQIFACDGGPFATAGDGGQRDQIIPLLCAGFNRSTLLNDHETPDPDGPKDYYKAEITNHYAKAVHEIISGGKGYAFPYDDVTPNGKRDQSGKVQSAEPKLLVITVGGR